MAAPSPRSADRVGHAWFSLGDMLDYVVLWNMGCTGLDFSECRDARAGLGKEAWGAFG